MRTYPFVRLTDARRRLEADGVDVIDFGIGEPREATPAFIRHALADAIEPRSAYPLAEGLPELREAAAAWVARRFGVALDPATEVVPTLGAKEAIFSPAQVVVAPGAFFGPTGEGYVRVALVETLGGATWPPAAQSLACNTALSPPHEPPPRGATSTAPVCELRRKSRFEAPESSPAFTTAPSGSVTLVPAVT